jgi:hypothetical protein
MKSVKIVKSSVCVEIVESPGIVKSERNLPVRRLELVIAGTCDENVDSREPGRAQPANSQEHGNSEEQRKNSVSRDKAKNRGTARVKCMFVDSMSEWVSVSITGLGFLFFCLRGGRVYTLRVCSIFRG